MRQMDLLDITQLNNKSLDTMLFALYYQLREDSAMSGGRRSTWKNHVASDGLWGGRVCKLTANPPFGSP